MSEVMHAAAASVVSVSAQVELLKGSVQTNAANIVAENARALAAEASVAAGATAAIADHAATNLHVLSGERARWNAKQDAITDLATIRSGASAGATALQDATAFDVAGAATIAVGAHNTDARHVNTGEKEAWSAKQDAIEDLSNIRGGAALGATALQASDVSPVTITGGVKIATIGGKEIMAPRGGGGGGTTDYADLENKPQINGHELTGNKSAADLGIMIPTKVSELTNDSGYLTEHQDISGKQDAISDLATIRSGAALGATALQSYTETDPTVPSWAKAETKPTYTAAEVGALPDTTEIPPDLTDRVDALETAVGAANDDLETALGGE